MDNQILKAALEYASRGWSVIPVSKSKNPLIKWKTATRDELTNPDNIRKWWEKFPAANVAIVTGERSGGLVVIDLDVDEEKGINGADSLRDWCEKNDMYPIESSATVYTGRGGHHLYFRSPYTYHNQVGCLDGVDIRGEGGCIVAPPSVHGTTRREYVWDTETDEIMVPEIDSDTAFFLGTMESAGQKQSDTTKPAAKNDFTKVTNEGGRNNQLFKYVSRLQGDGESDEDIVRYANAYNETHLVPPLDSDEVERTINSVLSHTEWKRAKNEEQEQKEQTNENSKKEYRKLKTAESILKKDIPEPTVFVGVGEELPLLVEGTCVMSAKPKLGKSWFVLGLCIAVSSGDDFLGYKTKKSSTLYLDLETSESIQKKRVAKILNGRRCPDNFYLESETDQIGSGFVEQIESYMQQDPNIGVVVIDVFQIIRSSAKSIKETEYEHAYRDITPLNALAQKYHIAIILVCHDRKSVDPDDPFSNILGSTGLQGAATQMIVMFRKKKEDPIHISVKGKTIDGLPELNVKLDGGQWVTVEGGNAAERESSEMMRQYLESPIRRAVIEIANRNNMWKGRCSTLINDATQYGIPVVEGAKIVGGFLHRHQGRFLKEDKIKITIIDNGTGPKIYKIEKFTIDTIDEITEFTIDGFEKPSIYADSEIPFL